MALAALAAASCGAPPPPVLGVVPPFALTERSGQPITQEDLRGHVWVADFVFTRCPDVCPALSARMRELHKGLPDDGGGVRLVSFTVDPDHDTPEVLASYATAVHAAPGWLFVTGKRDRIASLLKDGFKVAFADDGPPSGPITHSNRFVLVDRDLAIRGYYHGDDAGELAKLRTDLGTLVAAPRGG